MDWPPPKAKWPAGFTASRDGWVKWHRGSTRHVCGKRVPFNEVADLWHVSVKPALDAKLDARPSPRINRAQRTYREVLSDFLAACEARVNTGKPKPMSRRTVHNYGVLLNDFGRHVDGGTAFALTNRPEVFAEYAAKYGKWASSGWDSVVTRIGALYNWAADMEYIDRWRPGPAFQRPAKQTIRDERISRLKSIPLSDLARLYLHANQTVRCWMDLGIACAFINTDIANVPVQCVDLDVGLIDYRRRKTGKVRRVCPLPDHVIDDLRAYKRPEPSRPEYADHFFLSVTGQPYSRSRKDDWKPSDSISRLWGKLRERAGVPGAKFTGLRTTFYNLWPKGELELERKIVFGRAQGTIDLDHYLEDVGLDRLRHGVNHVWSQFSNALADEACRLALEAATVQAHTAAKERPVAHQAG